MTTDITELAPAMKAAAVRAQAATGEYASQRISSTAFRLEIEEFESLAHKPANVLALVEALEKAQAGEKQWREVVDAFCADDADWHKLTNSTNELISLLSQSLCKQADRIAELESRTVTVKLPPKIERDYVDGWFSYKGGLVGGGAAEWYNKALDDVSSAQSTVVTVKLPEVYGYLRENDGQIQISIGAERPSDRSGGYATPWFAIYTAAGIKWEAE